MASVESRTNKGKKTYRIRLSEGEHPDRPRIGLGTVKLSDARTAAVNISNLVNACNSGGAIPTATQDWLTKIRPFVRKRLESLGLIETIEDSTESHTVKSWCENYIKMREKDGLTKADTVRKLENVARRLSLFFKNTPLESVTKLEAKNFRAFLSGKVKLSEATVRKHIAISRQFFNAAIEARIIEENPFRGQPVAVQANKARFYFVTPQQAQSVLEACPDAQWRLIFGLARFGGLRCPSEVLRLKWEDVDFEHSRFTVHASKTEHHADSGIRIVPMFPELKPLFQNVFDQATEGTVYCITRYRSKEVNLRTQLGKIIKRAGLEPWPKLFQNLRSTRETELFKITNGNIKAVCSWIGNSPAVAMAHYAQVTEADMEQAAKLNVLKKGENSIKTGGLNRGQAGAVTGKISRKEPQEEKQKERRKPFIYNDLPQKEIAYESLRNAGHCQSVGRAGFEPA